MARKLIDSLESASDIDLSELKISRRSLTADGCYPPYGGYGPAYPPSYPCSPPPAPAPTPPPIFAGKNIILFLTDQERRTMHFPENWEKDNLPGLTRLKANGLSFDNCHTNTCMCSAARATLLSGLMPAQHGVRYVIEEDMPPSEYPQVNMPIGLVGLGSVASAAGYEPVYKGKLHLTSPGGPNNTFVQEDAGQYGWTRWNPPDDGGNQNICQGGGDTPEGSWPNGDCGNADARYMQDDGPMVENLEGALAWLRNHGAKPNRAQPFFLVVSLINPHDVLMYPTAFNVVRGGGSLCAGDSGELSRRICSNSFVPQVPQCRMPNSCPNCQNPFFARSPIIRTPCLRDPSGFLKPPTRA